MAPGSKGETTWRGYFNLKPDADYRNYLLKPFLEWSKSHAKDIARRAHRDVFKQRVSLILSAVLDRSTALYPEQWSSLIDTLRSEINALGLKNELLLGLNTNWFVDITMPPSEDKCSVFTNMLDKFLLHGSQFLR